MTDKRERPSRKSPWRFVFAGCLVYGCCKLLICLAPYAVSLLPAAAALSGSGAATIGIIGGADGPTAVFVTGPSRAAWLEPAVFLAAGIGGLLRLKHKKPN